MLGSLRRLGLARTAAMLEEEEKGAVEVYPVGLPEMAAAHRMVDEEGGKAATAALEGVEAVLGAYTEMQRAVKQRVAVEGLCSNQDWCESIANAINQQRMQKEGAPPDSISSSLIQDQGTMQTLEDALDGFLRSQDDESASSFDQSSLSNAQEAQSSMDTEMDGHSHDIKNHSELQERARQLLQSDALDLDAFLRRLHK